MIDPGVLGGFAAACVLLMLIPGPNWAVITASSVQHGARYGLLTVAATALAAAAQLALVAAGLAAALGAFAALLRWLRWAGAAWLIWLGVRELLRPPQDLSRAAPARLARRIVARGLAASLSNPKTMLFFAAFLPQFIESDRPAGPQAAALAATFVVVNVVIDAGWALLAARVRPALIRRARLRKLLSGGLMTGAGAGLGWIDAD